MSDEPVWLSVEDLVALNHAIVGGTGEPHVVLQPGTLEAARNKPLNHFLYDGREDVVFLAVTLCLGIAKKQAFQQGNKRTAWAAMDAFLYLNGFDLKMPDDTAVANLLVRTIQEEISEEAFAAVVDRHVFEREA